MIKYILLLWSCDKSKGNELSIHVHEEEVVVENHDTLSNDDPNPEELPDTTAVAIDESFYLYCIKIDLNLQYVFQAIPATISVPISTIRTTANSFMLPIAGTTV